MVLRAGIILPFQFGDVKKLLMVGSPEEDRDLKLFDFTNVVRAAFNIYNFEFRNKKIDFQIPEELLIHYLEQCKDLTNFVIQIDQAIIATAAIALHHEPLSVEPSCSQQKAALYLQKPLDSNSSPSPLLRPSYSSMSTTTLTPRSSVDIGSPLDVTSHSDHSISNITESLHKVRRTHYYENRTPESLTQSIDPNDIMPKHEHEDIEVNLSKLRQQRHMQETQQQQQQQSHHHHQHHQQQSLQVSSQQSSGHFFPNYGHSLLGNAATVAPPNNQPQYQQHLQQLPSRFRRRGERMSKDQKELYVKFFEENPCMLQQRRNDTALAPLWNKLANLLNAVQQGAVKNVEEWKQTFDAWRYRVFMYSRYNSKLSGEAAQNPKNYKPLTHTDQRAYAMWTSHKSSTASEYDKMDMFAGLEETQNDDFNY